MARAPRAWAINQGGKNSVRNLRYGPRTRLVRGIYFQKTIIIIIIIIILEIVVQERYQDIIFARMETFYSSTCISMLLVFEFLISFPNVCIFTDYVK